MNPLPATEALLNVAQRVIWFEEPSQALSNPARFLAYVMTFGTPEDLAALEGVVTQEDLRAALEQAPPGIFDARSWSYWHLKVGRQPPPPLPRRAGLAIGEPGLTRIGSLAVFAMALGTLACASSLGGEARVASPPVQQAVLTQDSGERSVEGRVERVELARRQDSGAPRPLETGLTWVGLPILVSDTLSLGALVLGTYTRSIPFLVVGELSWFIAPPIYHACVDTRPWASFGVRALGTAATWYVASRYGSGHTRDSPPPFHWVLVPIPFLVAEAIDIGLLAWKDAPETTKPVASTFTCAALPVPGGGTLSAAWRF